MASLIYHAGALGDFITVLPAVARWRQEHPRERFTLLGRPAHAAICAPPFDETWDAEARVFAGLFSRHDRMEPALSEKLQSIVSALVFARPESPLPGVLAAAGVKEIVRQDPFPPIAAPIIDFHLSLFPGPARDDERIPRISIPFVDVTLPAPVVLHPGSGSEKKNWPYERFLDLSRWLMDRGEKVAWVLGPAEGQIRIPRGHMSWRALPLQELASRLAHCRLFVGNDSGVTHLSAAAGCPTVALFGDSDPRIWSPRGKRVTVITSATRAMSAIRLEDVSSACQVFLEEK
jgi:ADP-heptose:LPS heptosyltransferase